MGRNLALIITPILFWVATTIYEALRKARSSPDSTGPSKGGVKALVSDPLDPSDPTPGGVVATRRASRRDIAEWMRQRAGSRRPAELIRAAKVAHGVSDSTAKRAWKIARRGQSGGSS